MFTGCAPPHSSNTCNYARFITPRTNTKVNDNDRLNYFVSDDELEDEDEEEESEASITGLPTLSVLFSRDTDFKE